jgi:tripartite ATP-independent transporter DctP family solute receptor
MGNFVSIMKVFSLPYMFNDSEHYWRVLEGEIGHELLDRLAVRDDGKKSGFLGLGYFDSGSRNFYATYPIRTPADMKGKKFRVMRDPVAMDLVESLGGSPTPIPWGELYTALKQGVVDGAENNPPSIVSSRHNEICKYLTLDAHSRIPDMVVVSDKVWQRLSDQERAWLRQAMAEATVFQRELWKKATEDALAEMKKDGVNILKVDTTPYREAVKPVVQKHAIGDIKTYYDRIRAAK